MTENIAFFVIGHSPAIITETLAARASQHAIIADEVRVVTTKTGRERLSDRLFKQGGWDDFCQQWPEYKQLRFDLQHIYYPEGMDDIRSEGDNRRMADMILNKLKEAIEDSDQVDASIAGGRKTMGYYLGFGMSLFARHKDRMTHVLVPDSWERNRAFLYPAKRDIERVELVDIPFIRLRGHLKPSVGKADMDALVSSAQTSIDIAATQPIVLRIRSRVLNILSKDIVLPEREFSILQFFALQKLRHCSRPDQMLCDGCTDCFLSIDRIDEKKEELMAVRMQFGGVNDYHYEQFEKAWRGYRAAAENLHEPVRRICALLEKHFATDSRACLAMIRNVGKKGHARYGIMADKNQIRIERE